MLSLVSSRIGRRLVGVVGAALFVLAVGGVLLLVEQEHRLQESSVAEVLETLAAAIASSYAVYDPRLGEHPLGDIAAHLEDPDHSIEVEVFDASGEVVWSLTPERKGTLVDPDLVDRVQPGAQLKHQHRANELVWPLHKRPSCLPCHASSPDPIAAVHLISGDRVGGGRQATTRNLAIAASLGVVLLVSGLLLVLIQRVVVVPVGRLVEVMRRVERGELLARAEVKTNDELGVLASSFNKLVARVLDMRIERIDTQRELHDMKDELSLKAQLAQRTQQLQDANRSLESRVEELGFLYGLGRELGRELEPQQLLERLARLVHDVLGVPEFVVLLVDPDGATVSVAAAVGLPEQSHDPAPFPCAGSVCGEALEKREPVYVPDLSTAGRTALCRDPTGRRGSLFIVPMEQRGRTLGVLNFSSPMVDAFSAEQRKVFIATTHQASLALTNAKLFQETLTLSRIDGLTGVSNRRDLDARLELEWSNRERYEGPLSLAMVDIDNFKRYNDEQGHQQGDEVLKQVAQGLKTRLRKTDALGRYGGEEFLAVLPRTAKDRALVVAEKLRQAVEDANLGPNGQTLGHRLTVSIGVATAPQDAASLTELVRAADAALLVAKGAGRNQVVCYSAPAKA